MSIYDDRPGTGRIRPICPQTYYRWMLTAIRNSSLVVRTKSIVHRRTAESSRCLKPRPFLRA